ncbi:trimeric intracellular cation channel family protein [Glacieibacterium megasporae]|uniref:trimeric intracellular cation channel family protein n=1 Tax=Glacieibacterium megasporae TaxID=2835787 RepID=UPI001C1E7A63|nr:TRIC cation channel family protein [Polymorphobacter megasporae]UAJ09431.1 TRIC cation channel family protein [Polymorphobacter megasporae]
MIRIRDRLLTTIDLAATLILSTEFALAGARADLDIFGIAVLAFVGAVGGGVMRDILLGEHPPAAFRDRRYPIIALIGASAVVVAGLATGPVATWTPPRVIDVIEAAGLALAAVAGARKALDYDLNGASVIAIAVVNGCGGGVLRDVLTAQIPRILRADFYATAAISGAIVMVLLVRRTGASKSLAAFCTGVTVFALRTAAIFGDWSLPHLR